MNGRNPLPTRCIAVVGSRSRVKVSGRERAAGRGAPGRAPPAPVVTIRRVAPGRGAATVAPVTVPAIRITVLVRTTVVSIAVAVGVAIVAVTTVGTIAVALAAVAHVLARGGSMGTFSDRVVDTNAAAIEFLIFKSI